MQEKRERNYSLDIIRILATFFVVSVHFFLHTGFYAQPVEGKRMLVMVSMRTLFMTCIPLFLMITGYLMNKKKLSVKYFKGIVKTLCIYVLASLACLIFKSVYLQHPFNLSYVIKSLVKFQGANYSWYIQMYIGLFIVIPFLNLIYNGLETKRQKQLSILGLILFVTVPPMLNKHIASIESLSHIVFPTWSRLYPITYYFVGAYICEYKPKMKNIFVKLSSALIIVVACIYYYWINYSKTFAWGDYQDSCALPIMLISVVLFIFLNNIDFSKFKERTKKVLCHISELTLGAYLMSYVFDEMIYTELRLAVPEMLNRFYYYPLTVILSFCGALIASEILNLIYKGVCIGLEKIKDKIIKVK